MLSLCFVLYILNLGSFTYLPSTSKYKNVTLDFIHLQAGETPALLTQGRRIILFHVDMTSDTYAQTIFV